MTEYRCMVENQSVSQWWRRFVIIQSNSIKSKQTLIFLFKVLEVTRSLITGVLPETINIYTMYYTMKQLKWTNQLESSPDLESHWTQQIAPARRKKENNFPRKKSHGIDSWSDESDTFWLGFSTNDASMEQTSPFLKTIEWEMMNKKVRWCKTEIISKCFLSVLLFCFRNSFHCRCCHHSPFGVPYSHWLSLRLNFKFNLRTTCTREWLIAVAKFIKPKVFADSTEASGYPRFK